MATAEQILESKSFKDAFKAVEDDLTAQFFSAQPTDAVTLQKVALQRWGLEQVKSELERQLTKAVETRINRGSSNE